MKVKGVFLFWMLSFTVCFSNFAVISHKPIIDEINLNVSNSSADLENVLGLESELLLDQSENRLTIYTSSGEVKTVSLPSSTAVVSSLSTEDGATFFINDLRGGDKIDRLLRNLTFLLEEDYIQDDRIQVIVLVGDQIQSNIYQLKPLTSTELEIFKNYIKQFNAEIKSRYYKLPFVAVELPYNHIFDLAEQERVGHIFLDRKFTVCLAESVPIVKPAEKWKSVEQYFGFQINGSNVKIAILDTGIDKTHPDLAGKVVLEESFTGEDTEDGYGHGTHCASIAAGTGEASDYIYVGVAPDALLMNVKVLSNTGGGAESWILSGIEWAVNKSAEVISMSFGADVNGDGTDPMSLAVDWASDQGVVCVAAAGNAGEDGMFTVGLPAVARKVITVGATNKSDEVAYFSSQGLTGDYRLKPDVCAPGFYIVAARAKDTAMGTVINEYYTMASGTSMSTPHVAGAAALLLQAQPDWNPLMVKSALMGNAKILDGARLWEQGAGRIAICSAVNTTLLIVQPSASLGMAKVGGILNETFTVMNIAPIEVSPNVSAITKCDGEVVTNVHLNVTTLTVPAYGNESILMTLEIESIEEDVPLGWWEGWLNVTSMQKNVKAPYFVGTSSCVELRLYDEDRTTLLSSDMVLASYPERNFVQLIRADQIFPSPMTRIYTRPGNYSLVIACPVVRRLGKSELPCDYYDDNSRSFMIEELIEIPRLSVVSINISLADAQKHKIHAKDSKGRDLLTHTYKQAISGGPYYDETSGTTLMNWTFETAWYAKGELHDIKGPLTLYTSESSDLEKLSVALGFFSSTDSLLSEVYVLTWKYWNASIPTIITQSYSDLAEYKIYYDMPETYPIYLATGCDFDFTLDYMSENLVPAWYGYGVHRLIWKVPGGVNATYYLTPEIASYTGEYRVAYSGFRAIPLLEQRWYTHAPAEEETDYIHLGDFNFGPYNLNMTAPWSVPKQLWYIHEPAKGETGYIHLGDFNFGPYTPGLTVQTIPCGDNCTINLTGDLWANLTWPHIPLTTRGKPVSHYPQYQRPKYRLYVDEVEVISGGLGRWGEDPYRHGLFWNDLSFSWSVTGQRAHLVLEMPGIATISESSIYQIDFDLTKNSTISPFFTKMSMPLNYSAGETITVNPMFRDAISNVTMDYSFDLGQTWTSAELSAEGFEVLCQEKRRLAIKINASDSESNEYVYFTSPAALCRDVKVNVLEVDSTEIIIQFTDIEDESLNNLAIQSSIDGIVSYMQLNDDGKARITFTPNTEQMVITFPCVGIYGIVTIQFQRPAADLNHDGKVDIYDLVLIASVYYSKRGDPNWLPEADIAPPWDRIDIYDIVTFVADYGKIWCWSIS